MKKRIRLPFLSNVLLFTLLITWHGSALGGDASILLSKNEQPEAEIILAQENTASRESNDTEAKEVPKKPPHKMEITVIGNKIADDGSPGNGYRVEDISIGPLGTRDIMNTPYSINVLPSDLMENVQAKSFEDVVKYLPSVQIEARGGMNLGRPQTRGFQGHVVQNSRMDGMNIVDTTAYPMEQFERIDVLNGLSGSLYGPATPAGEFSFVSKRPTSDPLYKLNISYVSKANVTGHIDIGNRIGEDDQFGYRINLLYGNGEQYVDKSNLRRALGSAGLDWKPFKNTVIEGNFSYFEYEEKGFPGRFSIKPGVKLPDAVDSTTVGLGQEYAGNSIDTTTYSLRLKHDFNPDWHLTVGGLGQTADRDQRTVTNTLINDAGDYTSTIRSSAASRFEINSWIGYLNGRFDTWGVRHDMSVGTNGFQWRLYGSNKNTNITLGSGNIYDPVTYPAPAWPDDPGRYQSGVNQQETVILTDTVTFNEAWSVMLSASQDWMQSRSFAKSSGATTKSYDDNGISPAASVMYKPLENMTAYVTYADSLNMGDTAPDTAENQGETLAPYRSKEWEVGFKYALSKLNLTAAAFRIERPFAYIDPADEIFKNNGDQVNYGLELMGVGEIIHNLNIFGGITFLDPQLKNTGDPDTSDKQVVGVPKVQANIFLEYGLDVVQGLWLNLNYHYTAQRPADDTNTNWAKAYNTFDIGARYVTRLVGLKTTWRFDVTNLTDETYWASVFPNNINGSGTSYSLFLGRPREFLFSMQFEL
jgi:iron complex outermembrane recepter protein